MNFKIRYNLWKTKAGMNPDASFKNDLKNRLDLAWAQKYPNRVSWFAAHRLQFAMAMSAVVLVSGAGTGAYAYASPDVTEGTMLYPIKQNIENVEEKFQFTPEAKAKFLLKKIKRREQEAEIVRKRGGKNLEAVEKAVENQISQIEDRLDNAGKVLEKIQSKDGRLREDIKQRLENKAELRKQRLEQRAERMKQIRERIESRIQKNIENN
jgi:hypothetical protein